MKQEFAIGVDLGGTKIEAGVVSLRGKIFGDTIKVPTEADKDSKKVIYNISSTIKRALNSAKCSIGDILGIGIGSPGPLDIEHGIILTPPNLPALHNFDLKKAVSKEFKLPVYVNNDANVFVLGESWFGAGKGASIVYGVTLGTGFGSGFVIDKKLYNGATGTAAEIWCFPYKGGIIEDYVSGRGLKKNYKDKTGQEIEAEEISNRALKGDRIAIEVWNEFGEHLGIALIYVVDIVDPEVIVVGGSISKSFKIFHESMNSVLRKHINPMPREKIKVVPASSGYNAGLIGAGCLVFEKEKN